MRISPKRWRTVWPASQRVSKPSTQDVYALADRARLLHEELDSKQSAETNRHLYILSLMTALLLPPSLVTGFFGMNTTALPFAEGCTARPMPLASF